MQGKTLFVEDDEDDVMLLRLACDRAGIGDYAFAQNGKRALDLVRDNAPDFSRTHSLIFLDLNMPEMNGFDFLRWLRKEAEVTTLPVIVLTTSENPRDIENAYSLGANAYLVKSTVFAELSKMISTAHTFWAQYNRFPDV
jgi:CheY-like chemotaxis protein